MSNPFFDHPILNSPYNCPQRHWELDADGQPTQQILEMRRRAEFVTPIPKPKKRTKAAQQDEMVFDEGHNLSTAGQQYDPTSIINEVRKHVDAWRALPNPIQWQVTPETARLLQHWRHHKFSGIRPFFCQVEAAETAIWLIEVASQTKSGKLLLEHLVSANKDANPELMRIALKLATGAGKTTVSFGLRAFIQACNILRSSMISAGVGLGSFIEHFWFIPRRGPNGAEYRKFGICHSTALEVSCELKVGINDVKPKSLAQSAGLLIKAGRATNSHFVFHFSRTGQGRHSVDRLQLRKRDELQKDADRIKRNLMSTGARKHEYVLALDEAPITLDLARVIRGIDVAGNENALPIEIFAPAIRFLRDTYHGQSSSFYQNNETFGKLNPWHLSIHAGEDFNHLASGLRAIDETALFCEYREGDRLGHALALGIDAREWLDRQGTIYLCLQEYVDNLVWCHGQAIALEPKGLPLEPVIKTLERKIATWSAKLYGIAKTPAVLHAAWRLRWNCPVKGKDPVGAQAPMWRAWVPDAELLAAEPATEAVLLWRQYADPIQLPERGTQICLRAAASRHPSLTREGLDTENIDDEEIGLLSILQDAMMERMAEAGIIIEACPTSNVYIGRLRQHTEHPIFRWDPPDKHDLAAYGKENLFGLRTRALSVCINTDDPGLMPTTIAHEHTLIEDAACARAPISGPMAQDWIARIRANGQAIFEKSHQDWHA